MEWTPAFFEESVQFFAVCVDQLEDDDKVDESMHLRWIEMIDEQLLHLDSLLKNPSVIASNKKKFQTCHGHLLSFRQKIFDAVPKGAGVEPVPNKTVVWDDAQSAFQNCIRSGVITNLKHIDPTKFLNDSYPLFEEKMKLALDELHSIHVDTIFSGEFKLLKNNDEIKEIKYFNTKGHSIFKSSDLKQWYEKFIFDKVLHDLEEFEQKESGWSLSSILNLTVFIKKFQPMHGGSSYFELPHEIKKKKACLNVENRDNQCFKWSILAALYPVTNNRNRVSNYELHENKLNFSGIDFPVQKHQISKFKKQNNVSVKVFYLKKKDVSLNLQQCISVMRIKITM